MDINFLFYLPSSYWITLLQVSAKAKVSCKIDRNETLELPYATELVRLGSRALHVYKSFY